MNAGDDNVFSRWSRRKLAARQPEPASEAEPAIAPDANVAGDPAAEAKPAGAGPVEAASPGAEPVDVSNLAGPADQRESLPRLEELAADTDLSVFLRKGVPSALRNSALRKMWSLDPAIRDHVGLAEYAWNFNEPGSMAGFGPLDAGSRAVDFLSTVSRSVLDGEEEGGDRSAQAAGALPAEPVETVPEGSVPDDTFGTVAPEEPGLAAAGQARDDAASPVAAETGTAVPGDNRQATAESATKATRQRHGGALPR